MRVVGRGGACRHVEDAHGEGWCTVLCRDHFANLYAIGQSVIPAWRNILIGFDYHTSSLYPIQPSNIFPVPLSTRVFAALGGLTRSSPSTPPLTVSGVKIGRASCRERV